MDAAMRTVAPNAPPGAITGFLDSSVTVTYEVGLRGSGKRQGGQQATSLTGLEIMLGTAERKETNGLWSPTWIDRATFDPSVNRTLVQAFDLSTDTGRKNLRTVRQAIAPILSETAQLAPRKIKDVATYYESQLSGILLDLAFAEPGVPEDARKAAEDWLSTPKEQRKIYAMQLNVRHSVNIGIGALKTVKAKTIPG
ncbi:hypothetical protein, partial [Streptomyces sp. NPDC001719]